MATANDMTARLVLEAEATGQDALRDMAGRVRELGQHAGDAAPQFETLATALDEVADQQALITGFAESKRAIADLTTQLDEATGQLDTLASEQERAAKAAADAAAAQTESASRLDAARAAQERYTAAVTTARAELAQLREAGKQGITPELTRATTEAAARLKDLTAAARQSSQQVKQLATEQRQAVEVARDTARAQDTAARAYDRQVKAAGQISRALGEQRRALEETRGAMQAAGLDTRSLQHAQEQVRDRMRETGERMLVLGTLYEDTGRAARKAGVEGKAGMEQAAKGADVLKDKIAQVTKGVAGLFAAAKLRGFAADALETADAFREMAERVRMTVDSESDFNHVQERLLETANRTYRPLHEQQELFIRSADALRNLGYELDDALDITDSYSHLLVTNAASGERAAGAVDALSRALQTGRVDARAWQTILAATPSIVETIAKTTGKTTEEIRRLGIEGSLSLRDVTEALRRTRDESGAAADAMATTVGDALTNLKNIWGEYLRTNKEAVAARDAIVRLVGALAENLETLVSVATHAGEVVLAIFGARAIMAVRAYSVELLTLSTRMTGVGVASKGTAAQIEAARASMQRFGGAIKAIAWAELAVQIYSIASNLIAWRAETQRTAAAQAELDATSETLAARLERLSETTGINVRTQADFRRAVEDGLIVFDAASQAWVKAADAQGVLAEATRQTADELAGLAAVDLVRQFESLATAGTSTGEALKQAFEGLDLDKSEDVAAMEHALTALRNTGVITLEEMASAWKASIAEMDTGQLKGAITTLDAAVKDYRLSATDAARINEDVLARSFELLGVNGAAAMGSISAGATDAIAGLDRITAALERSGASAEQSARALEMAFEAAVPKADSLTAIDVLDARLTTLAASGRVSADAIDRMRGALERQRSTIEQQIPGVQSLAEALRKLGVTPQEELERLARTAREAFDQVRGSATATARETREAWTAMANAAIAANGGVADETIKAEARLHGLAVAADDAGDKIVDAAERGKTALENMGDAGDDAGERIAEGAEQAADAAEDIGDAAEDAAERTSLAGQSMTGSWVSAATAASRYAEEAKRHAWEIEGEWQSLASKLPMSWDMFFEAQARHLDTLRRLSDEYVAALERIDAQQQQVNRSSSGAAAGVAALEMRLIELNGTEDQIARARLARDQDEIRRQIELQRLEMERARLRQDDAGWAQAQEEVELLERQLELTAQIFETERRRAAEKARSRGDERPRGGRPDTTGDDTTSTGGGARGNISITVNANGINDPVQLARRLEPELRRLGRLAR